MPTVKGNEVFKCDYTKLEDVIALCNKLGPSCCVVKYPDRPNYNITHVIRAKSELIVHYGAKHG